MGKEIIHTRVCDLLGTRYPIILAGMGSVSGPSLVAAVSTAGGLGVLERAPGAISLATKKQEDIILPPHNSREM